MPAASFPADFLWGVATAGHQNEGDNVHSDTWFLENVTPTVFQERSGKAANGWELWESDLDLVAGMNLNAYRFSVEWARIEPVEGEFSEEALAHYEAVVDGCLARGLAPIVTFNHFTSPHWFAARGAWLDAEAPDALRPVLRRRDGSLRRPHPPRRDVQRARPARDADVGGSARLRRRPRGGDARGGAEATPGSSATAPATSCCTRTSPGCARG